ncbi:hypothetical protein NL676_006466 [Syzygium grande]|nr:hypothetical protein NL676_006466 [Syzygium grande]
MPTPTSEVCRCRPATSVASHEIHRCPRVTRRLQETGPLDEVLPRQVPAGSQPSSSSSAAAAAAAVAAGPPCLERKNEAPSQGTMSDAFFACKKQGHWMKDCPDKSPAKSRPSATSRHPIFSHLSSPSAMAACAASPSFPLLPRGSSLFCSSTSAQDPGGTFVEHMEDDDPTNGSASQPCAAISVDCSALYNPPEHSHEPNADSELVKHLKGIVKVREDFPGSWFRLISWCALWRVRYVCENVPDRACECDLRYDLLHNAHLNLEGLDELFKVAQLLADGVIPNEYGINPKQKLKIGSKKSRCETPSLHQEHILPIMGPERMQETRSGLTLEKMERMLCPFAMPPEDFPPPTIPHGFTGYFFKSANVLECLVNWWRSPKHANRIGR